MVACFVPGESVEVQKKFDLFTYVMSSEQSRKVLEDIQRAKNKLLKDGAAASLGLSITYPSSSSPTVVISLYYFGSFVMWYNRIFFNLAPWRSSGLQQ